jgi:hypothetical protein
MITYPWARTNEYFVLVHADQIAFGGGGAFGLFVDGELQTGSTSACATFASAPLTDPPDFTILALEIWSFL